MLTVWCMCQVWYAWWIGNHIMTSVKMCGPPPAPGPSAESSLSWVMAFRKCTSMTHRQKSSVYRADVIQPLTSLWKQSVRVSVSDPPMFISVLGPSFTPAFPLPRSPWFLLLDVFCWFGFLLLWEWRKKKSGE